MKMDSATDGGDQGHRASLSFLAGVACTSAAVLVVELSLTRIFSVTMFYHFASMAISIALFGLSASGVFIYITPRLHAPSRATALLPRYALAFAVVTVLSTILLLNINMGLEYRAWNLVRMFAIYLLGAAPFFAGGLCLTVAMSRAHADIHRVYAADLAGAAAGCLLLLPALNVLGGPGALLLASSLAAAAAVFFARLPGPSGRRESSPVLLNTVRAVAAVAALAVMVQAIFPYLDVVFTKGAERHNLYSKWNSFSRIAVYPGTHADWGLSDNYKGPHPDTLFMDIDASASTTILLAKSEGDVQFLKSELTAFGYSLMPKGGHALVIGPGGGRDLWSALVYGAGRVNGVEVNDIIAEKVMGERYRAESGDIYHRNGVEVAVDDGRSFVARSQDRYDVIQASLVDTWAATAAGAFTLTENNLYTAEAFEAYFRHLKPGGVLCISRWADDGLRLLSLARAAGERMGWPGIADRLYIARHDRLATFIFKNGPISEEEKHLLDGRAGELGFQILYEPGGGVDGDYKRLATAPDAAAFYRDYPAEMSPSTDDHPFFFNIVKPREILTNFFSGSILFGNGQQMMIALLAISTLLVAAFILGPLFFFGRKRDQAGARSPSGQSQHDRQGRDPSLAYFACLGTGFMLVEMGMMQRFVLFLGHPIYSLAVILFTLLLGGGIGSALGRRLGTPRRTLAISIPVIIAGSIGYALVLPSLFESFIALALPLRIGLSMMFLLPLGIVLGMPLPTGLKILGARRPERVSWAWGVNGATSVLGAASATFVALNWGFTVVAFSGAIVYAIALGLGLQMTASQPDRIATTTQEQDAA